MILTIYFSLIRMLITQLILIRVFLLAAVNNYLSIRYFSFLDNSVISQKYSKISANINSACLFF